MAPSTRSRAQGADQPVFQLKSDLQRQRDNYGQKLSTSFAVDELRVDQGPRGFTRPGAMGIAFHMNHHNAVYQSLMHLPIFVNWIRSHDAECGLENCHLCHLKDITNLYWGYETAPTVPVPYTNPAVMAIRRTARRQGNYHISPHSFYPWLTRKANLRDPLSASWNHEAAALFELVLNETRTCQTCNRTRTARHNEQMLEVDYDSTNHAHLENMVTEYFRAYDITQHCPTCNQDGNMAVSRTIEAAPQVLRISVNIYKNGGRWKQDDAFVVPENLQLVDFQRVNGLPLSYTLSSSIAHGGLGNAERMVTDQELEELELDIRHEELRRPTNRSHGQANAEDANMEGMEDDVDDVDEEEEEKNSQPESLDRMEDLDGLEEVTEEQMQEELGLQQHSDDEEPTKRGFSGIVDSMSLFDGPRRQSTPRNFLRRTYDEHTETESAESDDVDMLAADDGVQEEYPGNDNDDENENDDNNTNNPYASGIYIDADDNFVPVGHDRANWRSPSRSPLPDGLPRLYQPPPDEDEEFAIRDNIPLDAYWGINLPVEAANEPEHPSIVLTIPIRYRDATAPEDMEPYWDAANRIEINVLLRIDYGREVEGEVQFNNRTVVVIVNGRRPMILYNNNPAVNTDAPIDFDHVTEVLYIDGESHEIFDHNHVPAVVVTNQGPGRIDHNVIFRYGVEPDIDISETSDESEDGVLGNENEEDDNVRPDQENWVLPLNIYYDHDTAPTVLLPWQIAATHVELRDGHNEHRTIVVVLNGEERFILFTNDPTIDLNGYPDLNRATQIVHLNGHVEVDVAAGVLTVTVPRHDRGVRFVPMVNREPQDMPLDNEDADDVLQVDIIGRNDEAEDGQEWDPSQQLQTLYDRAHHVGRMHMDSPYRTFTIVNREEQAIVIYNTNPDVNFDDLPYEDTATDVITIDGQITNLERIPFYDNNGEEVLDRATVRFGVQFYPQDGRIYTPNSPRPPPLYRPPPASLPLYSSSPYYLSPTQLSLDSSPPPSSPPRPSPSPLRSLTPIPTPTPTPTPSPIPTETSTAYSSASSSSTATTIRPDNFSHYIISTRGHAPVRSRRRDAAPPAPHQFYHVADEHSTPNAHDDLARNPQRVGAGDACPVPPGGGDFQVVLLTYTRDKLKGRAGKMERMIPGVF